MWRRPKWQTVLLLVAFVLMSGQFLGMLTPNTPITCPTGLVTDLDGDHQRTADHQELQPLLRPRAPHPIFEPDYHHKSGDSDQTSQNPHSHTTAPIARGKSGDFNLISELNSTVHDWPWPGSKAVFNVCDHRNWYALGPLPNVSVIISFVNNEDIFNIIHTLHAVVQRSPPKLLTEIILIDDNTSKDEFLQLLEMHLDAHFSGLVRLIRSKVDLGLIQARLNGIRAARGQVVIVLDSHVEPQHGWLEPILYEIAKDRRTLASPFLDWMQKRGNKWTYRHGASTWKTYFDWSLTFGFQALSDESVKARIDPTQPIRSAVTVGTWAMDKSWFEEVGAFDEGMQRWGGENLDLAVRVWLFGGRVVNLPCSHVAHLEKDGSRDYRNSWSDMIHKNYKRFVEVWLDDYKKYFYLRFPHVKSFDVGDLSARVAVRKRAKYNFSWFLRNVFPELGVPDENVFGYGGLQSLKGPCFDTMYSMTPYTLQCSDQQMATQNVFWTKGGLLRLPINIVTSTGNGVQVFEYTSYHNTGRASIWFHVKNGPVIDTRSGLCLEITMGGSLSMGRCRKTIAQYWRFRVYSQDYDQLVSSGKGALPEFKQYSHLFKEEDYRQSTADAFLRHALLRKS